MATALVSSTRPRRHRRAHPVFTLVDRGFVHSVYVMYHGTQAANVDSILSNGFDVSKCKGGMLGQGIYASTDANKTRAYGDVTLKLLVYVGKVRNTF